MTEIRLGTLVVNRYSLIAVLGSGPGLPIELTLCCPCSRPPQQATGEGPPELSCPQIPRIAHPAPTRRFWETYLHQLCEGRHARAIRLQRATANGPASVSPRRL